MLRAARELNLSETVFFLPASRAADVRVRIFTKARELPFAGHPVLGSAFVLGEALGAARVVLQTGAGPLAVHLARHGRIGFGEEIEISQGQEIGRPSRLYARAEGSADQIERVLVGGSAVIVARGEYRLS
jgi:trans-2,3-dihydro-3-hydroxyanthranilate isomerase